VRLEIAPCLLTRYQRVGRSLAIERELLGGDHVGVLPHSTDFSHQSSLYREVVLAKTQGFFLVVILDFRY